MTATIQLDRRLTRSKHFEPKSRQQMLVGLTEAKWHQDSKEKVPKYTVYHTTVPNAEAHHASYLDYLGQAWQCHYPVQIAPDIIWFELLCELAGLVKDDPETYRHLFTSRPNKVELVMSTPTPQFIPMNQLQDLLKQHVPTDAETFMPYFSTSHIFNPERAYWAAFADMATPFYNYSTFLCGIPRVEVLGTSGDWTELLSAWRLAESKLKEPKWYFGQVEATLKKIVANCHPNGDPEFWRNFFRIERCGSGSEYTVEGEIRQLFRVQPEHNLAKVENFASHRAQVPYFNRSDGQNYKLVVGLLWSTLSESGVLCPRFGETTLIENPEYVERFGRETTPASKEL